MEHKTSKIYGSSRAGNAQYFGIKKNDNENTYYISKKVNKSKEQLKATYKEAEASFPNIIKNLQSITEKLEDINKDNIFKAVEEENIITSSVMLRKVVAMNNAGKFLYIYSDDMINKLYKIFVTEDDKKLTNIEKNKKLVEELKNIFEKNENENDEEYILRLSHFLWGNLDLISELELEFKNMIPQEALRSSKTNIIEKKKEQIMKQKFSDDKIDYNFNYKNILLKGVPGTGKSRTLDNIITNYLNLKEKHQKENVLRVNIHSASSNADLMQGIGISSSENGNIEYKEKQGLILEHIEKATFKPNQPFVLVLEEIQENSLNELIGDLIYLIEKDKRADGYLADNKKYTYTDLIDNIMTQNKSIKSVKLPSLISQEQKSKRMIIPENLFIFCTSNYRDDRKVIEDNLLRRFEVIEIYPKYKKTIGDDFKNQEVSDFLEALNKSIVTVCRNNGEIHPDRFMIGHSIWLDVESKEDFSRAFLKVITEFKDVKDMHFDDFQKIVEDLQFPFEIEKEYESYEEWIDVLQNECYDFLKLK